jgi:hypothetical protein
LSMRTAKADQSLRTMLSGGQSAQVRTHYRAGCSSPRRRPIPPRSGFSDRLRRSRRYRDCASRSIARPMS